MSYFRGYSRNYIKNKNVFPHVKGTLLPVSFPVSDPDTAGCSSNAGMAMNARVQAERRNMIEPIMNRWAGLDVRRMKVAATVLIEPQDGSVEGQNRENNPSGSAAGDGFGEGRSPRSTWPSWKGPEARGRAFRTPRRLRASGSGWSMHGIASGFKPSLQSSSCNASKPATMSRSSSVMDICRC